MKVVTPTQTYSPLSSVEEPKAKEKSKKIDKRKAKKQKDSLKLSTPQTSAIKSSVSLGFDDPHPVEQKSEDRKTNRHGDKRRAIHISLVGANKDGVQVMNPLPFTGFGNGPYGGVSLKNPPTDPDQIFAVTDNPSQTVAALYDHLSEKFPELEDSVLYRLAKVGTFVAIDVPLMVAAHEMGHGGSAIDQCPSCSPTVVMTGWMSGYTSYDSPSDFKWTDKQNLLTSVAGMNQATYGGEKINRRMHTEGASVADAVAYLTSITNSVNYQIKDWATNAEPGYNDAATYHTIMENRQKGWNEKNLSMLALGVNLLNADFWASLVGTANYIATGKDVKLPEIQIGDTHVSMPHFSLMHTYEGPQLNVSVYGHKNTPETLEIKYSSLLTPDNGPGMGLETRLHNWAIPNTQNQLSLSPGLGLSIHDRKVGFKAGAELEYRPDNNRYFSTTFGADYRYNYLPDAFLPNKTGIDVKAGIKISF